MYAYLNRVLKSTIQDKSYSSLDGLRAISVLMVIIGHLYLRNNIDSNTNFFIFHDIGVSLFFVISGFLITGTLIKELKYNGWINLKIFFLKRLFRIFPAYYFFLIVWMIVDPYLGLDIPTRDLISCFLYLGYYYPPNLMEFLSHTWSLAVEEQFYIIWPMILKFFKRRRNIYGLIITLIILSPFSRVLTYLYWPIYKNKYHFLIHTRIDALMTGCLLAFLLHDGYLEKMIRLFKKKESFYVSCFYLLVIYPFLNFYFHGYFRGSLGYTLENIAIVSVILHLMEVRDVWYFKILNSTIFKHLGSISYGLYLWQQPFTYLQRGAIFNMPYNIIAIYFAALLSMVFIEYPALSIRNRILKRM